MKSKPKPIHHLALGTSDVERLARFYCEVFGLEEQKRHLDENGALRSIWLQLGGALLMIERSVEPARHVEGVGRGLFLLAFEVTPGERDELERELTARGCSVESRTPYTSYARDPDGNRIAVSHYPMRR